MKNVMAQDPKHCVKKLYSHLDSVRSLFIGKHWATHNHVLMMADRYEVRSPGLPRVASPWVRGEGRGEGEDEGEGEGEVHGWF